MLRKASREQRTLPITSEASASVSSVAVPLILALVIGCAMRQWAYHNSESVRYDLNQQNAYYWGAMICHAPSDQSRPQTIAEFWQSYISIYERNKAHPAPAMHTLDYVPLRLLMAGAWVRYLDATFGPGTQWRPEFARSFAAFSMGMELIGAVAMFLFVAQWLKQINWQSQPGDYPGLTSRHWKRWEHAAAAASLLWLNPAAIIDSHVWPHGQTWILPFYLFAILLMIRRRFLAAGVIFGFGIMVKGQMLLVAPLLILWPIFDGNWLASARVTLGMACGILTIASPWILQGSFTWMHASFAANGLYSDVLRKGQSLNLPALLEVRWKMTLHQHVIDQHFGFLHFTIELKTALIIVYAVLLACCAWGIAGQAKSNDRRLLVSIAAPWALMFFILGQMDERYLVWSGCFTAAAITVNWRAVTAHVLLTAAGALTMLEYLIISKPNTARDILPLMLKMNPALLLGTAAAVAILFFDAMPLRWRQARTQRIDFDSHLSHASVPEPPLISAA